MLPTVSGADGVTQRLALSATTGSERGRASLIVLEGTLVGRRYLIDESVVLGRGDGAGIQVDDAVASRRHALIRTDGAGWRIVDLKSQNGTWLNGNRIYEEPLQFGDRVQVGESLFLFSYRDPLEDRARQRQKLETLGRLGAGVAHDLNNLLGSILANADLVLSLQAEMHREPDQTTQAHQTLAECVHDIRLAAQRGGELTRRILDHAATASAGDSTVDLSSVVLTSVSLARRTFDSAVRVDERVAPGVLVRGDRSALSQVVMGLLVSAGDALPLGGRIQLRLGLAAPESVTGGEIGFAGQHALLEVQETAARSRTSPPLEQLAKQSEGGPARALATAAEIIGEHGGRMTVDTEGHGTLVRVILPALATPRERVVANTPHIGVVAPVPRAAGDGMILVVDDDDLVRRTVLRVLERDGYKTLEAPSGRDALTVYRNSVEEIRLVLLDLDMPDMNGEDTYEQLRGLDPQVRVAFLTGLCDDARRDALLGHGARAVLLKPCDTAALRRMVREESGITPRAGSGTRMPKV